MPTPPTYLAEYENGWSSSAWPRTVSVTTAVGDRLLCAAMNGEYGGVGDGYATPTGGTGLVWTLVQKHELLLNSTLWVWTATAVTAETLTLSVNTAGSAPVGGIHVTRANGSSGFGTSVKGNGTGAPSLSITPTAANSMLVYYFADWNETSGAARVWRTINGYTPTPGGAGELVYQDVGGAATFYGALTPDAGPIAADATGLGTPATTKWVGVAVEVLGSAGGGAIASTGRGHGAGYGVGAGTKRAAGTAVGSTPGVGVGAGAKRAAGRAVGSTPGVGVGAGAKRAAGAGVGSTPGIGMGGGAGAKVATGAGIGPAPGIGVGVGAKRAAGAGAGSAPLVGVGASKKRAVGAGVLLAGLFAAGQARKTARGAGVGLAGAVAVDRPALPVVGSMHLVTRVAGTAAGADRTSSTATRAHRTGPTMTGV